MLAGRHAHRQHRHRRRIGTVSHLGGLDVSCGRHLAAQQAAELVGGFDHGSVPRNVRLHTHKK